MNKNSYNKGIKRRLIALLTIAVFVFVMGFNPIDTVAAEEVDEPEAVENTEAVDNTEAVENEETEATDSVEPENDEPQYHTGGMGYNTIPELSDSFTIEKGDEPSYLKKKEKKLRSTLPDVYEPWTKEYYNGHVQMLDQDNEDLCWSYAICTAAQISYLKEMYDKNGSVDSDYDLSPDAFAYFFYNREPYRPPWLNWMDASYGYTDGDKNIPLDGDYSSNGGNNICSVIAMADWMGMHSIDNGCHDATNAYNTSITLENAMFISNIKESNHTVLNEELTKEKISQYGAVGACMHIEDPNLDEIGCYIKYDEEDDYMSSYCDYSSTPEGYDDANHAIVIVGWDDNFPKENFVKEPNEDGAWIVQNSWGSDMPGEGFIYISYEDISITEAVALDMQEADRYDANYHYDGASYPGYIERPLGNQVANVFTVPEDTAGHTLEAVGFGVQNLFSTEYKVTVYRNVATTPTTGEIAAEINVTTRNSGSYTFNLEDYGASTVDLLPGEKYAVVVEATATEGNEKFRIWYEKTGNIRWASFVSEGREGTSFYRTSSGDWLDAYQQDNTLSFRIKAFTKVTPDLRNASITIPAGNYSYTGKYIKPPPEVISSGQVLTEGEDYTVSYKSNKYPGVATMKVEGIGSYYGTQSKTFTIAKVENFHSTKATKTTVTLAWKKSPNVKGYKIYRLKSGKYRLIKTIKRNGTVKFTNKKLKTKRIYKYKIRTYKKIGKKTYYGPTTLIEVKTK